MKYASLLLLLGFSALLHAQAPNPAYRLPESSDMPDWAKKIYRDDISPNVQELDLAVKPWKAIYDSLKIEMTAAGEHPDPTLEAQYKLYKKYYKYYARWRYLSMAYIQPDGSVDYTKGPVPPKTESSSTAEKPNSTTWQLLGPTITYWAKNDNAAQPPAPWQANVYSFDVAPSNSSILYYGTETGALGKTTDKGTTWTPIGQSYTGFRSGVGAIAIHPGDPNTVFAGNSSGVHKSTDGGANWAQVLNMAGFNTNDIKVNPNTPEEVLAAGTSLQRYTTAGGWSSIIGRTTYDLAFKPDNSLIVYALVRNAAGDLCEFYKSEDGGQNFTLKSNGWITAIGDGGGRMSVTTIDANKIYVVLLTTSGPRVLRSDDAGENWTLVASGGGTALPMDNGQGYYDLSITVSNTNANHIVVATTTAYKSTDGGVSYTAVGGYTGSFGIHPDIQEMKTVGSDSWIVTDGGINLSTDFWTSTSNFSSKLNGLTGTAFWGFDVGWNEDAVVGGRYHNGNTAWHENYTAGNFLRMGGGEQATGYLNPGNGRMAYFSDLGSGGRLLPAAINQTFSTFSVTKFPNESYFSMQWSEQVWDPRSFYSYYIGKDNILWRTQDNGKTFDALFTHSDATSKVQHIQISRSNPDVMYCTIQRSSSGELWKSIDGGGNWTQCINPTGPTASERRVSKVALSGTDANVLWWCFRTGGSSNKIFKSTDGGQTWSNWTSAAIGSITLADMVHQLGSNGGIYINGDYGEVFYRNNSMTDWTAYKTGLPAHLNTEISRMKIQYKKKKLRMASINGVWEVDLFENSSTTLPQPMADYRTASCDHDTIQLESFSVVNGPATYQWSFSPAPQWISNNNIRNPKVVFGNTAGNFAVTLSVTDDNGTTSKTVSNLFNNLPNGNLCALDTIPGKSLLLDGSGDYAVASNNLNLNSNTVTMTAWVKRNGAQVDFSGLLYLRGGTTSCGLSITSANALRYTWDEQAGSYNFNTGFTIPDNVWTHIALVVSPTNAKVYMNGVAATRTAAHAAEAFDTPLQVGFDNGSRYFKGQIDEVTIWNRSLSQDSIRELMHLTKAPDYEPKLINYYQFNEASGSVQDKARTYHLSLIGNAQRQTSTCPIGKGYSARQTVNGSGMYSFGQTGLTLTFPPSGPYPAGELCASRINQAPDQLPNAMPYGKSYWIVNNYGTNASFAQLSSLLFADYDTISNAATANQFELYKRSSFADGNTWGTALDLGDVVVPGVHGSIEFNSGNGVTSFSQLIVTNSAPVPVEWIDFRANVEDKQRVRLDWKINQWGNVSHFDVERSSDGVIFTALGRVEAKAGNGIFTYQSFDDQPSKGRNYYRIKEVDSDGRYNYSILRSAQLDGSATNWIVYPNPLASGASLKIQTAVESSYDFMLYDAVGKMILKTQQSGSAELQHLNLSAGVYHFEIVSGGQREAGELVILP